MRDERRNNEEEENEEGKEYRGIKGRGLGGGMRQLKGNREKGR